MYVFHISISYSDVIYTPIHTRSIDGLRGFAKGLRPFELRSLVVDSDLAIQSLISFRSLYLGQIGCQGDGLSRQPILGVHMLSMTHREAAIFDDACTVPTPCLLLPGRGHFVLRRHCRPIKSLVTCQTGTVSYKGSPKHCGSPEWISFLFSFLTLTLLHDCDLHKRILKRIQWPVE